MHDDDHSQPDGSAGRVRDVVLSSYALEPVRVSVEAKLALMGTIKMMTLS